jgi:hypothetical protein
MKIFTFGTLDGCATPLPWAPQTELKIVDFKVSINLKVIARNIAAAFVPSLSDNSACRVLGNCDSLWSGGGDWTYFWSKPTFNIKRSDT